MQIPHHVFRVSILSDRLQKLLEDCWMNDFVLFLLFALECGHLHDLISGVLLIGEEPYVEL